MRKGIEVYFGHVNKEGGVNGRQLILKSLDDGYEADRAVATTKKLIEEEKVFALLGYVGTPTTNAACLLPLPKCRWLALSLVLNLACRSTAI